MARRGAKHRKRSNEHHQSVEKDSPGSGLAIAIGDVGVLLCDLPDQLFSWVLVFTGGGQQIAIQVQTSNLTKRGETSGAE